ncbi:MAG: 4-(cytidine 5'-diphospho)-2-C-methyl-D-erythritol kinase [Pseudomonadota bacterium]
MLSDVAPAKVNLSLRIPGRFEDGYHAVDSVVAFSSGSAATDSLSLDADQPLSLTITGSVTGADAVPNDDTNLVLCAARAFQDAFPDCRMGAFALDKRLPVAAGIGGGSSDAAAALRLLATLNNISDLQRLRLIGEPLGADIPVCVSARAQHMAGRGERVTPLPGFPELPAVLVNPRVGVLTADVFAKLGIQSGTLRAGHAEEAQFELRNLGDVLAYLDEQPNDLQTVAIALCPQIAVCIDAVVESGAVLTRMSGSGATVFGLFDSEAKANHAARTLSASHQDWWVVDTVLS